MLVVEGVVVVVVAVGAAAPGALVVAEASPGWTLRSRGGRQLPESTAAATVAISSGLAVTRPWPMTAAACSVVSTGVGNLPPAAGRPGLRLVPKPKLAAAAPSCAFETRAAMPTKAVLHEMAKARWKGMLGAASPSKLVNRLPPMTASGGHGTAWSEVTPAAKSAAVVTTLNVDPGG